MNVLAIGNDFSKDATRYLHQIAANDGCDMTVVNLNAYQSSLSEHYRNNLIDVKAYTLEYNGKSTGFKTSIKEALLSRDWDVVVLQQLSSQSFDYETFQPYIDNLAKNIRKYSPKCQLVLHQTWAYAQKSKYLYDVGYEDKFQMSMDVKNAYEKASIDIKADKVIPSGEMFLRMETQGVEIYRDGKHASLGIGRYGLGLLWYACLTGKSVAKNTFSKFDESVSYEDVDIAKRSADDLRDY